MDGTERSLVPGCPNKNINSRSASSCAAVRCFLARLYLQTNSSINNWLLANRQRTRQRQRKMFRHLINKLLSMDLFVRLDRQWTAGDNMQTLWLTGHHFCWAHLPSHIPLTISLTFSCRRSSANWRPTAFMSVLWRAEVTYMCMSRNLTSRPVKTL